MVDMVCLQTIITHRDGIKKTFLFFPFLFSVNAHLMQQHLHSSTLRFGTYIILFRIRSIIFLTSKWPFSWAFFIISLSGIIRFLFPCSLTMMHQISAALLHHYSIANSKLNLIEDKGVAAKVISIYKIIIYGNVHICRRALLFAPKLHFWLTLPSNAKFK